MTMNHELTADQAGRRESHPSPHTAAAFGQSSKIVRPMRRLTGLLLLAALGAMGQWQASALLQPPATTKVRLTWGSLGAGTRYYVQTSTNLVTWTAATNTTSTNVSLSYPDKARTFRVSVSNAPPQSVTLAWNPNVPATDVTGYSIYYGVSPGNYTNRLDVGPGTNSVVPNLTAGANYYFATTAHSSSGLESDFSNEAVWQSPLQLKLQRLP